MAANFFFDSQGATKVIEDTKKIIENDLEKVLATALTDARDEIIERTSKGQTASGGSFKGYTPAYSRLKADLGRNISVPDLTLGVRTSKKGPPPGMLRSIQVKVIKQGKALIGSLFFPASQQGKARGNNKLRPFFELSKKQLDNIERKIKEAINGRR